MDEKKFYLNPHFSLFCSKTNAKVVQFRLISKQTQKNFSDLPNKDLHKIAALKKIEGGYELTLSKPVAKAYAAGTGVRNHFTMNWIFTANRFKKAPKEWTKFSGKISGFEKGPGKPSIP